MITPEEAEKKYIVDHSKFLAVSVNTAISIIERKISDGYSIPGKEICGNFSIRLDSSDIAHIRNYFIPYGWNVKINSSYGASTYHVYPVNKSRNKYFSLPIPADKGEEVEIRKPWWKIW